MTVASVRSIITQGHLIKITRYQVHDQSLQVHSVAKNKSRALLGHFLTTTRNAYQLDYIRAQTPCAREQMDGSSLDCYVRRVYQQCDALESMYSTHYLQPGLH